MIGHIGVTPQTAGLGPGFKMRTHRDRSIDDARSVEAAGAYAIVLEVVDYEISREITEMLSIPTIGIGSGSALRFAGPGAPRDPGHVSALAQLCKTLRRLGH